MVVCRCSSMASSSEIFSWRLFSVDDLEQLTSVWMVVIWDYRGTNIGQVKNAADLLLCSRITVFTVDSEKL